MTEVCCLFKEIYLKGEINMSIFDRFFRSRDKPKNLGSGGSFWLGNNTTAGKIVTSQNAMQITAVYACVRILAEAVAGLPLHLYRYEQDGSKKKAVDNNLYWLLHNEPNPEMTSFVFRETMMEHLLLSGNAYAQNHTKSTRRNHCSYIRLCPIKCPCTAEYQHQDENTTSYTRSMDDAKVNADKMVVNA